jgi:ribosomal protein S11
MSLRTRTITLAAAVVAAAAMLPGLPAAAAAAGCAVTYATPSQWPGGFTANVTVTNLGDAINGWNLTWAFTGGQQVQQAWSATVTQNATQVSATNMSYNAQVATNGTVSFGFNGVGSASPPASFSLNGAVCTGGVDPVRDPGPARCRRATSGPRVVP